MALPLSLANDSVDSRPLSLEASWMLQILDLISLASLVGCER